MSFNIDLPNITDASPTEQIRQLKSYLFNMAQQLNWALNTIETGGNKSVVDVKGNPVSVSAEEKDDPISTFNQVKALIIKSSDIVNAYYEEIDNLLKLSGEYVAEATFPDGSAKFIETTSQSISASSKNIELLFENTQTIASDIESVKGVLVTGSDGTKILGANAWVNIGVLGYDDDGYPLYGMEIGQTNSENGVDISKKFAQYRSDGVHLYDQNGTEVAWISNNKLHITYAEITGKLTLGEFVVDIQRGFTLKWVGGGS